MVPFRRDTQIPRATRKSRGVTPLVEPLSLDEAFLDVAGSVALFGPAAEIGRRIKETIRAEIRLIASVGVAPNKFISKIASDLRKPDGLVVVEPDGIRKFLDPLPVGRIWGVGKVTGRIFGKLGVRTIGDLRRLSDATLGQVFGSSGEHYRRLAEGIDDHLVPVVLAKLDESQPIRVRLSAANTLVRAGEDDLRRELVGIHEPEKRKRLWEDYRYVYFDVLHPADVGKADIVDLLSDVSLETNFQRVVAQHKAKGAEKGP